MHLFDRIDITVQHWDGYLSVFDAQDLALLDQKVTR